MITTFCLTGFTTNPRLPDDWLGAELFKAPFVRRDVLYANKWFGQSNFDDGRAKLKAALLNSKGNVVVLGQSMGARIACAVMDDPDVLAACPPSRCVFVLTGHPDRKFCGASTVSYSGFLAAYGVDGIPDGCQYRVWDVARQYDIAADYPTNRSVRAAVSNVSSAVHGDYSQVRMGDSANVTWPDPGNPNVTFVLSPTYPLPDLESKWVSVQRKADDDARRRPAIEAAYARPVPVSTPTINRLFSTGIAYDSSTRSYVRIPAAAPWNPFRGQGV